MIEDVTLEPIGIQLSLVEGDGFEIIVVTGVQIPIGNGMAGQIPAKATRIKIRTKKELGEFIDNLKKAFDEMPEDAPESNVLIANNLQGVENMAENLNKLIK